MTLKDSGGKPGSTDSLPQQWSRGLTRSFDSLTTRKEQNTIEKQGQASAGLTRRSGWKPVTLHPVALLSVTVFTAALIAVLSYLSNLDAAQDGLAFASADDGFTTLTTFSYLYLPTIISVSFSMLWAWIDLDVKRLEPFFQMSQSGGASAAHSILLQYPFEFIALAPVQAARRRHWGVVVGGLVTVLIFWAITPLQGAVFDSRPITKTTTATFSQWASLSSIRNSGSSQTLDIQFLEQAWNIIWHNASLPAFSTSTGAIVPVDIDSVDSSSGSASVKVNSTMLTTSVQCHQAVVDLSDSPVYKFTNGRGCAIVNSPNFDNGRGLLHFGYTEDPRSSWTLQNWCSQESVSNSFVNIVSLTGQKGSLPLPPLLNITAQFCAPAYWSQPVEAMIRLPGLSVEETRPMGEPTLLTSDILNTTTFENIISTGYTWEQNSSSVGELSAPALTSLAEWFELSGFGLVRERVNMEGFILGVYNLTANPFDNLFDAATMARAVEQAHQLLFSVAAAKMLSQSHSSTPDTVTGTLTRNMLAVRIIHPFDYIMQGLLGTAALCSMFLAYFYWRRDSGLIADLSSLRDIGTLQTNVSHARLASLSAHDASATFELQANGGKNVIQVTASSDITRYSSDHQSDTSHAAKTPDIDWPFYFKPLTGIIFITILVAVISVLVVLQRLSVASNGLHLPWQSSAVQQIVLNYLPTLVATFLEPFWTLLNRMSCILQPFEEMRASSGAKGPVSIDSRYTSLPPQLNVLKTLRNRHFWLVSICLVGLSANILAVSMNALFQQSDTPFIYATSLSYASQNTVRNVTQLGVRQGEIFGTLDSNVAFQDHFYLANMNLTESASLPVWTANDHFILPLLFDGNGGSEDPTLRVDSPGLAVSTDCKELAKPSDTGIFQIWPSIQSQRIIDYSTNDYVRVLTNISVVVEDGTDRMNCSTSQEIDLPKNGTTAFETILALNGSDSRCSQHMFVMYARNMNAPAFDLLNATNQANSDPLSYISIKYNTFQGSSETFMLCKTTMATNIYRSQLKPTGELLSSDLLTSTSAALPTLFQSQADADTLAAQIVSLNSAMPGAIGSDTALLAKHGHSTAISPQWFTHLMAVHDKSSTTIDPTQAAPQASKLGPLIQAVNAQLGALLIHLQMDVLFPASSGANHKRADAAALAGSYEVVVTRLFFNTTMFGIAIGLLALNLVAAVVFYVRPPRRLATRIPTTIYDQLQLFRGSSIGRDCGPHTAQEKYGYGRYLSLDGELNTGIERVAYVQVCPHQA